MISEVNLLENTAININQSEIPVLALRGIVVFPKMVLHFDVGRKKSIAAIKSAVTEQSQIFLVAQKDINMENPALDDLFKIGTVCTVKQVLKLQNDTLRVVVEGAARARLLSMNNEKEFLSAQVRLCHTGRVKQEEEVYAAALIRQTRELFEEFISFSSKPAPDVFMTVMAAERAGDLADYLASNLPLDVADKQAILQLLNPLKRLEKLCSILSRECEILALEKDIGEKVNASMEKNQREYYLREQIKAIYEELGETDDPQEEAQAYRDKILSLDLTEEIESKLLKEADKIFKMPPNSHEASVIRSYLDVVLDLPWNVYTDDNQDLKAAKAVLDADHYGLQKVKERIVEMLAVRKLAPDISGQIICLAGPPGVGKTSIAKSLASAMNRRFARISLGGVRDEAEIRGHRKTYIGAMPGRIINAVKQAGSSNPLILLDEIDKLGADYKGDPSSALLEALDPEQNHSFRDHYLEVPFDLSKVLFITTANDRSAIPGPLLDRMELVELPSYTHEEKFHIARRHLIPKQVKRHGLNGNQLRITDDAVHEMIDSYTREAGVRKLEREIASVCRKTAAKVAGGEAKRVSVTHLNLEDFLGIPKYQKESLRGQSEVGIVTGLAWTAVGGDTLCIETAIMDGTGKLELTGNLGNVMKESAKTAVTCVRGLAKKLSIDENFYQTKDIHIHVPEGAVPKDGPSAGITMATAIVSALTQRPVSSELAMTGEISLRGRVLPIGGLKEKSMAAYRLGIKKVLIPEKNQPDLQEVDPAVLDNITFIPVATIDEVMHHVFGFEVSVKKKEAVKAVIPCRDGTPAADIAQ